jgi:hypothetical protein
MAAAPAVPMVDFSAYTRDQHSDEARIEVARQMDEAFRTGGLGVLEESRRAEGAGGARVSSGYVCLADRICVCIQSPQGILSS